MNSLAIITNAIHEGIPFPMRKMRPEIISNLSAR